MGRRFDEEEEEEAEDAIGKKEEKKDKKKDDKKGKRGKDAGGDEDVEEHQAGTSALVEEFVQHIQEYTEMWEDRDEAKNFDQKHDVELARKKVYPIVEAKLREIVDDVMREELANLKTMYEKSKKKKEKGKKGKKGGKGKKDKKGKVKKWCAAVGMVSNREDCFPDLVEQALLKKIKPERFENIYGEFQYLGAIQRVQETYCPPPSMQMIKSLAVEHCMLTLAST